MTIRFRSEDREFDSGLCAHQLNLLAHAQAIELDIGSECGGHGICGRDRVRLPAGAAVSPITEAEREHLSAVELHQGWRLACQCFPERDHDSISVMAAVIMLKRKNP